MSIPRLGFKDEVIGSFQCNIHDPNSFENSDFLIFEVDKYSLIIENNYYKKLYDDSTIDLILSVDCFDIYKELKTSIKDEPKIEFPRKDAGGKFVISIYFVALKNFTIDTNNNDFDSFYDGKYSVEKGQIVSKVIKHHINVNLTNTSSSFKFLSILKNPELTDKSFEIKLEEDIPSMSIKSEEFFGQLNRLLNGRSKAKRKLADAIFLGPLYIELFRIIIAGRLDEEEYNWAINLSKKLGYTNLEELKEDITNKQISDMEVFENAYNFYADRFYSDKYFKELIDNIEQD